MFNNKHTSVKIKFLIHKNLLKPICILKRTLVKRGMQKKNKSNAKNIQSVHNIAFRNVKIN